MRYNGHTMSLEKEKDTLWHTLLRGVVYGIGFFIGSAIVATILLGVVGPYFIDIPWVHDNFIRGTSILR